MMPEPAPAEAEEPPTPDPDTAFAGRPTPSEASEPVPDTWLDTGHARLERLLFKPVIRFDRFFSDERELEAERSRSFLRFRNEVRFREDGSPVYGANVRASLRFPGVNQWLERLRLDLVGETEDTPTVLFPEDGPATAPAPSRDIGRANAELRFGAFEGIRSRLDLGAGVLVDIPPGVFTRLRYRAAFPVRELFLTRVASSVFWRTDTLLGTRLDLALERPFRPTTLLRLNGSSEISQRETRGVEYASQLALLQALGPRSAVAVGTELDGASSAPVAFDRYRVFTRYRRDFFRRWLFLELEPEIAWPWSAERGRHREIAGTLRFEVQFQGPGPNSLPED